MNHLQPANYGADAVRSYSSGSYGSSVSSASSSTSGRATARTSLTSPSLSQQGTPSPDTSASSKFPDRLQPLPSAATSDSEAALSPLELLMKRGKQVQHDILEPSDSSTFDPHSNRIYERATALSRKTSVRKPPVQPSPDPDDFDDTQSIRSVNLLSEDGSSFSRSQRRHAPASAPTSPDPDSASSSFRVERGYRGTFDDRPSSFAGESNQSWQRQSSHLLGSNAFRGSVASDISFSSISADLSRRASIDTVRSSEFGEDGRWGRAWSSRAEDEESVYGESTYGDELDADVEHSQSSLANLSLNLDPSRSPGGLSSVAQQWKRDHAAQGHRQTSRSANTSASNASSHPTVREVQSKEKIVSLTRAVPPPTTSTLQQPTSWHGQAHPRHSMIPQIDEHLDDAGPRSSQLYDQTPLASADRYLGHRNTASTSTITGDPTRRRSEGSPQLARVYVYPPSPSGSEASRSSGGANGYHPGQPRVGQQRYPSMPNPASAKVESFAESPKTSPLGEARRAPLAPSNLLSGPRSVSAGTLGSRPRVSGHPAGRAPPPPPPAAGATPGSEIPAGGYGDPNEYFQGVDRPIIGRKRQEAIARADGRESMVSDLDVETLRLDGSSRRSSTSTINSIMTSRMSVGSVKHDPSTLQSAAWRDQSPGIAPSPTSPLSDVPPHLQAKASQSSFRSLQPMQDSSNAPSHQGERPAMLRNAKSSTNLGSVPMQTAASAPAAGLGSATPLAKPRTSPAVDTRTGPSTAEDFLSRGITYHEQGDLARSAFYFERSAKVDGGCVVGMCMFGMALREGWGARKDPVKGFTWIQRAAARAGEMMTNTSTAKSESELRAIKSELKLSVYELGKCFCYGWGVKMDKQMALEYFELAAKLGDADAQAEAGALYAAGKGCKKDLKKAAMYYRMAEEGGYDTVGLSWIHKDKYK